MTSAKKPTYRLAAAALGMCLIMVRSCISAIVQTPFWWSVPLYIAIGAFGVYLAFVGVYRLTSLHLLWGWACLILVCVFVAFLGRESPSRLIERGSFHVITGLAVLCTGYLLVFDRKVAAYRKHLNRLRHKADAVTLANLQD